ncbi:vomeronasal type-2 receptor 116-like [Dama dama]
MWAFLAPRPGIEPMFPEVESAQHCVQCPDQEYPSRKRNRCLPRVLTFVALEDSLGMSLACTALCFCVLMAAVLWVFVKHRDTPIVKANNRALSHVLLISLLLCVLCSLLFINHPHTATCELLIMCNKGSVTAFYCVLGHPGSLALGTLSLAFLDRNLPDTFSEAKFLTFSMLVLLGVWVTFLPICHSTKGKVKVAVEIVSILASRAGLLGCIFAPKCYITLLRLENSLKDLKYQTDSKRNLRSGLSHSKLLLHLAFEQYTR